MLDIDGCDWDRGAPAGAPELAGPPGAVSPRSTAAMETVQADVLLMIGAKPKMDWSLLEFTRGKSR